MQKLTKQQNRVNATLLIYYTLIIFQFKISNYLAELYKIISERAFDIFSPPEVFSTHQYFYFQSYFLAHASLQEPNYRCTRAF